MNFLQETLGVRVLPVAEKKLMCGDIGKGAMLDVSVIGDIVTSTLSIENSGNSIDIKKRDAKADAKQQAKTDSVFGNY